MNGLVGITRHKRRSLTKSDAAIAMVPDLLQREFTSPMPRSRLIGHIGCFPTGGGSVHLAAVPNLYSKELIYYVMALHVRASVAIEAITIAHRGGLIAAERWLVAPYGVTDWVRNARVAGRVTLSRGGHSQTFHVTETALGERVPVLRRYPREVPVTRAYFDTTADSTHEQWTAEAARHPVFRLTTAPAGDCPGTPNDQTSRG